MSSIKRSPCGTCACGTCAWHLRCVAEFSRIGSRRRLAAPLARLPRRAKPWEARPAQAGPPRVAVHTDQGGSTYAEEVHGGASLLALDCPLSGGRRPASMTGLRPVARDRLHRSHSARRQLNGWDYASKLKETRRHRKLINLRPS